MITALEQGLIKYSVCNLGAINLAEISKDGKIDYELLEKLQEYPKI